MHIKKLLRFIIITTFIPLLFRQIFFNEPIFIFLLYMIFYKDRYLVLGLSSVLFFYYSVHYFLKNIIFMILFEIFLIILTNDKINTKGKYRTFLLTFLVYLVLINVFEPMVYNYNRLLKSTYLYSINIILYKLYIIINKFIKGSDYIERGNEFFRK